MKELKLISFEKREIVFIPKIRESSIPERCRINVATKTINWLLIFKSRKNDK
jgi:hypothetical protein